MQFEKWVKNQLLEREAAGLPTSPEGLDALKAWARGGGLSHHVAASDVGMGCGLAALWVVGLVFTFVGVGAWVYLEDASRGASESDLVLVMLVPLALLGIQCLAVAVGLTIWQIAKRSGDRQNVEMTERT